MSQLPIMHPIKAFGKFQVYRRGSWHLAQRLPKYAVTNLDNGLVLEEFRRLKPALKWAGEQNVLEPIQEDGDEDAFDYVPTETWAKHGIVWENDFREEYSVKTDEVLIPEEYWDFVE